MATSVVVNPMEVSAFHTPAVGVQATVSSAAPSAKANVILVSFSATLVAGVAAEKADVLVRDGASGVGTILKRITLACAASGVDRVVRSAINLPMTPGNVCTVEFAAAPTGTGFETVEIETIRTDQISTSSLYGVNG